MAKADQYENMSYAELAEIQKQIATQMAVRRDAEIAAIAEDMKARCQAGGIRVEEVVSKLNRMRTAQKPAGEAKYRDPASGKTWSGRGKQPNWIKEALGKGKSMDDFAI